MSARKGRSTPVATSSVCYFCDEMFASTALLQSHFTQCSVTLESCPRNCGAWLERRSLAEHALHCPRHVLAMGLSPTGPHVSNLLLSQKNYGLSQPALSQQGNHHANNTNAIYPTQYKSPKSTKPNNDSAAPLQNNQTFFNPPQWQSNNANRQSKEYPATILTPETAYLSSLYPSHQEYATSSIVNLQKKNPPASPNGTHTNGREALNAEFKAMIKQGNVEPSSILSKKNTPLQDTKQYKNIYMLDNTGLSNSPNKSQEYSPIYTTAQQYNRQCVYAASPNEQHSNTSTMLPPYKENIDNAQNQSNSTYLLQKQQITQNNENKTLLYHLKEEFEKLRFSINAEKLHRELLTTEMSKLRRQYLLSEDRNQILLATIATLRKNLEDEAQQKAADISGITCDVDNYQSEVQNTKAMTTQLELRLDGLGKSVEREQVERSHLELIVNNQDGKLRTLHQLETDLETLRNEFKRDQLSKTEYVNQIQEDLKYMKGSTLQEVSMNKTQLIHNQASQEEIIERLNVHDKDISKFQVVLLDAKSVKATVEEDSKKLKMAEEKINDLKREISGLQKERFAALTSHDNTNPSANVCDSSGRLLWRITNFKEKLNDAVDNASVLLSPIFYTSKYGYALQAEIFMNGAGKWRGRHITASVFRQPGEFDPLLSNSPDLTASIALKDQAPQKSKPMDIVKTLVVKRKEIYDDSPKTTDPKQLDRRSTSDSADSQLRRQYVFIPHTSLDKFDYIKNDVMFIEIIVTNT